MRPGNRYNKGKTLGDLVRARLVLLAICRRCKHERIPYPHSLIERFGEDTPAIDIRPLQRLPLPQRQPARDRAIEPTRGTDLEHKRLSGITAVEYHP